MAKDEYRRLAVALAILAPVTLFFLLVIVPASDLSEDYILKVAGLALLCGPAIWGLVRLLGWAMRRFSHFA